MVYFSDNNSASIAMLKTIPSGYKSGEFELDDNVEELWQIKGITERLALKKNKGAKTSDLHDYVVELVNVIATETCEAVPFYTEKPTVKQFTLTENCAVVGAYLENPFLQHRYGLVIFILMTITSSGGWAHMTQFACDKEDFHDKIVPFLSTALHPTVAGLSASPKPVAAVIPTHAPAKEVLAAINFNHCQRVKVGEYFIGVPKGMHHSTEYSSDTRLITCIPDSVSFKSSTDFDVLSSVMLTLQQGQKTHYFKYGLNSKSSKKEIRTLFSQIRIDGEDAPALKLLREDKYLHISYGVRFDRDDLYSLIFYLLSREKLYVGQLFLEKRGIKKTYKTEAEKLIKQWLGTVEFAESGKAKSKAKDAEKKSANATTTQQTTPPTIKSDYMLGDKINALKIAKLFEENVLYFDLTDLKWDGEKLAPAGITLNSEKQKEHKKFFEQVNALLPEIIKLFLYLQENKKLNLPIEVVSKDLQKKFRNQSLTGLTALLLFERQLEFYSITSAGQTEIQSRPRGSSSIKSSAKFSNPMPLLVDTRVLAGLPDAKVYITELFRALYEYNHPGEELNVEILGMYVAEAEIVYEDDDDYEEEDNCT